MSVLARSEIQQCLKRKDNRLVITPLLSSDQLGAASVDVRLGNEFILLRKRAFGEIDIGDRDGLRRRIGSYQERIRIDFFQKFVLHPNQLVLGSTLEYLKLPSDIACQVLGRSSLGRLGLVIETASSVAPHFRGCITLELINIGEVPIALYPGVRIAQLVIYSTTSNADYSGRYKFATGPQFSRVYEDGDLAFWARPGQGRGSLPDDSDGDR